MDLFERWGGNVVLSTVDIFPITIKNGHMTFSKKFSCVRRTIANISTLEPDAGTFGNFGNWSASPSPCPSILLFKYKFCVRVRQRGAWR